MPSPYLIFALLLTVVFTLATRLSVWREQSAHLQTRAGGVMEVLMGDSRRLFANHFITKADVYLHGGVYPSIFDQAAAASKSHLVAASSAKEPEAHQEGQGTEAHEDHDEHDAVTGFLGKPKDWIDAFGRNFYPSRHIHLQTANEREILPWFRIAAELNPNEVQTYTVAAYWLRTMGKVSEAESFLREGWRANPDSFEILFELGRLNEQNRHDDSRARNLFLAALRKWQRSEAGKQSRDEFTFLEITGHLARLEQRAGNLGQAIQYLEMLEKVSPSQQAIREQIEELRKLQASGAAKPKS